MLKEILRCTTHHAALTLTESACSSWLQPRRILLALCFLFCASICWGQYLTSYQQGVTDISSYLPTVNAWKALPGTIACIQNTLTIGGDGYHGCLSAADGYFYIHSGSTWTKQGAMGNTIHQFAVFNMSHIYGLAPDGVGGATTCQHDAPGNWNVVSWSGSAWSVLSGCGVQLAIAPDDGTFVLTNTYGQTFSSPDGQPGHWTLLNNSSLSVASAANASDMCGVGPTGTVYALTPGTATFAQLTSQPTGGTPAGCAIFTGASPAILTWTASGVVRSYDPGAGAWSTVTGTMYGLTAETKAKTLGVDASGHPYHLNVYPAYLSGTTSGSLNQCPVNQCPEFVYHQVTIQIKYPHGLWGAQGNVVVSPTTNVNVSSFDASPTCDPLFGDPSDPECSPVVTGSAHCDYSGQDLPGGAGGNPPPTYKYSENYVEWDSTNQLLSSESWHGSGWQTIEWCGTKISGCRPPTVPYCGVDALEFENKNNPMTQFIAEGIAYAQCQSGPWAITAKYFPGQPNSCVQIAVDRHASVPQDCF